MAFAGAGVVLLGIFVTVESRSSAPLVPLAVFRRRTFAAANIVAALLWAAFFANIFQGTLFLQQTLGCSAVETGVAWLASTMSSLVIAGAIAPRCVGRFGASGSLVVGQAFVAAGLLSLTRAPVDAGYWSDLFPGFLAFGIGLGFSIMAAQVAVFTGIDESVAGLAGGMIETAREIGGALGVAVLATIAISRTEEVLGGPGGGSADVANALTKGFQRASLTAAGFSIAAALAAGVLLRRAERTRTPSGVADPTGQPVLAVSDEFPG